MNLFYLNLPKRYEQTYLNSMKDGLLSRICDGVGSSKISLTKREKSILLPKWNTDNPDTSIVERLLIAEPRELKSLNDSLMSELMKHCTKQDKLKNKLLHIFDYDGVFNDASKKRAFELSKRIGANTCCYCNRQYTFTIEKQHIVQDKKGVIVVGANNKKERIARPAFDHWFPKSEYPLLSLSLYNLIPCCNVCNSSVKGSVTTDLDKHIHPYVHDGGIPKIAFKVIPSTNPEYKWTICLDRQENSKEDETIKMFCLDDIYKMHDQLELKDIMDLKEGYSDDYIAYLIKSLQENNIGASLSFEDIYRIMFGSEYNDDYVLNRPLGKMKNDIIKTLLNF